MLGGLRVSVEVVVMVARTLRGVGVRVARLVCDLPDVSDRAFMVVGE